MDQVKGVVTSTPVTLPVGSVCLFLYVLKPGILMIVVMQFSEKDNTFAAIIRIIIQKIFME